MQIDFNKSETKLNLMRAFAGESQARNRYTFGSAAAKAKNLHVIDTLFTFTANQEKEHAEIFYQYLTSLQGETIHIDGGYPVDISESISSLLRSAQHNEFEEHDVVYKAFGDKALEEGFTEIAASFHSIALIEKTHGERFEKYASLIEQGKLFASETEVEWMCLNCGHIHSGKTAPSVCPVCKHSQGYFARH